MNRFKQFTIAGIAIALSSCTTGQLNVTPPLTFTKTNAVLELSVGTVNFAGAAAGLNVLETDRSGNGYTAIPAQPVLPAPQARPTPGRARRRCPSGRRTTPFLKPAA
jgi:hypothetical protein